MKMPFDTLRFTPDPGTYVLMLSLAHRCKLAIGKLGQITFGPGWYAYVGSAFGPGGLAARLKRHLRSDKKSHWHVDYFRREARVVGVWTAAGPSRLEHRWAADLIAKPLNGRAIIGFGCSDCKCKSHLIHFEHFPDPIKTGNALGAGWSWVGSG